MPTATLPTKTRAQRGSILPKGKDRWLIRGYHCVDSDTGREIRFKKTIPGTRKDAQRALTKEFARVEVGGEPAKLTSETFGHWLDTWVRTYCAHVRDKTRDRYASLLTMIPEELRSRKLAKLSSAQLQAMFNELATRPSKRTRGKVLSTCTLHNLRAVIRAALSQAVIAKKVAGNVAAGRQVRLPKLEREEMKVLGPAEAKRLLTEAEKLDGETDASMKGNGRTVVHHWVPFLTLMLTAGLRPGEICGLKWPDLYGNKLRVQRALSRYAGAKWKLLPPKTNRSRRVITLPEMAVRALKRQKADQAQARLLLGKEYNTELDLVFATHSGEPLDLGNFNYKVFKPLLKRAGLPALRLYDLRHSAATILLAAGEHPKIVAERLGHSTTTLTMDTYSHVLPDMQDAAAGRLDILLAASNT